MKKSVALTLVIIAFIVGIGLTSILSNQKVKDQSASVLGSNASLGDCLSGDKYSQKTGQLCATNTKEDTALSQKYLNEIKNYLNSNIDSFNIFVKDVSRLGVGDSSSRQASNYILVTNLPGVTGALCVSMSPPHNVYFAESHVIRGVSVYSCGGSINASVTYATFINAL